MCGQLLRHGTLSPIKALIEITGWGLGGFHSHSGEENNPNTLTRYEPRISSIQPVTT
jgi:hypothetical protein